MFYFIINSFKRKSVQNLTQESIKVSKISYFFSFNLREEENTNKKYDLKKGGVGLQENFRWKKGFDL